MNTDSPIFQKQRIENLIKDLLPQISVEFYPNDIHPETSNIRFRLRDNKTGKLLGGIKADNEWESSEVADMSDQRLLERIHKLIH